MSTVSGRVARSLGLSSCEDIAPGVAVTIRRDGIDFDGDLTTQQQADVYARMTSRDDADQAARADIAALRDCLTAATLPPELEPLRALVTALADYTLGV